MMQANRKAFLDTIAFSEGTSHLGDNGYNVVVGGTLFRSYATHPHPIILLPNLKIHSTAAGRYQLLFRYYEPYRKLLKLKDFSPESQDKIAIQQIKECKALGDVDAGNFTNAVQKCAHIWASLPGAGYGQHENTLVKLEEVYKNAGGVVI
jgi:muramidase (phage lysozyme)